MKSIVDFPEETRALSLHAVGDLRLERITLPELKSGEVLLRIRACGICSSDLERVFENGTYHFPTVLGHEFSGEIVAVADSSDEYLLGKRTCVFPLLPCGTCKACEIEEYAQCCSYSYFGSRCDGGFSEYLIVPKWNLVLFDESVSYETAALCEPSAVSLHAVNLAEIKATDTVAVVGTGTIGLLIALCALKKTKSVVVLGRSEEKLAFANKLGLKAIDTKDENFTEVFEQSVGSSGADVVFEVVGTEEAINMAVSVTETLGRLVLVGNPKSDIMFTKANYWSILRKQLVVKGSWNSSFNERINDWSAALELFKDEDIPFDEMVTHSFSIEQHEEAFALLKSKDEFVVKAVFKM